MKKLMMMAVAVLFAASANAQGDIVKLIKKAKTYSDAMQLVNQGVSALSNEDKAKVYTKVCDLAAKEFSTEQDNYIKKDLNPGGYDVNNAYTAAQNLIKSALSLRDADPKAAIKYIDPVNKAREMMLNAGQEGLDKKDFNQILSNLGLYVDAANVVYDGKVDMDPNVPQISYFATWGASELNDAENVMKYSQYALNDSAYGAPSMALLLNSMEKKVASKQDSVEFVNKLKGMIGKYPGGQADGAILGKITTFYGAPQYAGEVNKLLDETIAANPNNKMAWALKGQVQMNNREWDAAVESYKKAIEIDPEFVQCVFNAGVCLSTNAIDLKDQLADKQTGKLTTANADKVKAILADAKTFMERARELDPDQATVKWLYPLYQIYYNLGEKDKAAELEGQLGQ
jgi:tetratricopeptide (TPR) repeat protein